MLAVPTPVYFLKSPRLGFRIWSVRDLRLARTLWGNLEVSKSFGGPFSESQIHERLTREISFQSAHNLQYWPIFLLNNDAFVGCCGLHPYDLERQIFELGYHLCPQFWGKRLATEAAQSVISHAFGTLGLKHLFAGHHPDNVVSKRILEKLGFRYTHDEFYSPTGLQHPSYLLMRSP